MGEAVFCFGPRERHKKIWTAVYLGSIIYSNLPTLHLSINCPENETHAEFGEVWSRMSLVHFYYKHDIKQPYATIIIFWWVDSKTLKGVDSVQKNFSNLKYACVTF